jgi:hypothetical protein
MPENTEARDIAELGTTLYDRSEEIADLLELLNRSVCDVSRELWSDTGDAAYHHAANLRRCLRVLGERLNPTAAADSIERNEEPLELAKTDGDFLTGQFKDAAGDDAEISWRAEVGLKSMLLLGCVGDEMILTRQQVAALLPHLRRFVEMGRL